MKAIGGYFGLEKPAYTASSFHSDALHVNSGRAGLECLLKAHNITSILIPKYTCDVVLEPIKACDVKYKFYAIDKQLQPIVDYSLLEDTWVLVTNYFGIQNNFIKDIVDQFGDRILIDNSQAFFFQYAGDFNGFYSPRKFFGLADGGQVYSTKPIDISSLTKDDSSDRCAHLLQRIDGGPESGYDAFKKNDALLSQVGTKLMSDLSRHMLTSINQNQTQTVRQENFDFLHETLGSYNELKDLIDDASLKGPMVYPLLIAKDGFREHLLQQRVFVARYWPNLEFWLDDEDLFEQFLFDYLLPLPIDQRYSIEDMNTMATFIKTLL